MIKTRFWLIVEPIRWNDKDALHLSWDSLQQQLIENPNDEEMLRETVRKKKDDEENKGSKG